MERLRELFYDHGLRNYLRVFTDHPEEVIDYVVEEEKQGRGLRDKQAEKSREHIVTARHDSEPLE